MKELDPFGARFDVERTAASAAARAFATELERTLATLDTAQYEAVEVIQFQALAFAGATVGGETSIRKVPPGAQSAEELAELGAFEKPVERIARYEAETIDTLRTYVAHGDVDDVARLADERFEIGERDPHDVAEKLIESLEQYADEWGDA